MIFKMDGTLFAAKQSALKMAKINIKYLGVHVEDDQVDLFIKEMEEILKRFAGQAYHFCYDVERPYFDGNDKRSKTPIGSRS
jgi:hypothetical protein